MVEEVKKRKELRRRRIARKMEKVLGKLSYPLFVFNRSNKDAEKTFFNRLVTSLKATLGNRVVYSPIRSIIADVFKLAKNAFGLGQVYQYLHR